MTKKLDEKFYNLLIYLDDEELMNIYNEMYDEIDYEKEVYENFVELSKEDKKYWIKKLGGWLNENVRSRRYNKREFG